MEQQSAIFAQLHQPTGITHCASAFLTHAATGGGGEALPNLVVARSTALDVYSIRPVAGDWKLALRGRFPLFGVVESLVTLPGGPGQRDALLLTFREAKLSVLAWDCETAELVPSGLHYFEGDPALRAGRANFPVPPMAVADPQGRCAAVVMNRHQLAVLPAMREEFEDGGAANGTLPFLSPAEEGQSFFEGELGLGPAGAAGAGHAGMAATLGNSYVDNLAKAGIKEVRDAVFLHGYSEPVLLVLHEEDPTWAGNLRTKKDTCCLTALSLNLSMKRHPRIWAAQHLPSDAYRLIPVPSGGALVLCTHMVLFYAQGHQAGVVVNSVALGTLPPPPPLEFDLMQEQPSAAAAKHARQYATSIHPDTVAAAVQFCDRESAVGLGLELDGACGTWLPAPDASAGGAAVLLLALRSGQLALVRPVLEGSGGVKRLVVAKVGAAPPCSCIATLGRDHVFLGSHQGDSLLVRAAPALPAAPTLPVPAQPAAAAAAGAVAVAAAAGAAEAKPELAVGSGTAAPQPPSAEQQAAAPEPAQPEETATDGDMPSPKRRRIAAEGEQAQQPQQPQAADSSRGAEEPGQGPTAMEVDASGDASEVAAEEGAAAAQVEARAAAAAEFGGVPPDDSTPAAAVAAAEAAAVAGGDEGAALAAAVGPAADLAAAAAEAADTRGEPEQEQDGAVEEYYEGEEPDVGEEEEEEEEGEEEEVSDLDEEALIYGEALDGPSSAADGSIAGQAATAAAGAPGGGPAAPGALKYSLKIVDSLVNIGPIRDMSIGGLGSATYPPFLVTCGGRERGGALCMLRQHVTPEVITDVPLQGVVGVWAVHQRPDPDPASDQQPQQPDRPEEGGAEDYHSYLLISFPGSTKVLATGEELQEVTDSMEFATDTTTIAAGSICGGRRIVQAFPEGVRILAGGEVSQDFWAAELQGAGAPGAAGTASAAASVSSACILDPYVLVHLSDGTAVLLEADAATGRLTVAEHGAPVLKAASAGAGGAITASCLLQDSAGVLSSHLRRLQALHPHPAAAAAAPSGGSGGVGSGGGGEDPAAAAASSAAPPLPAAGASAGAAVFCGLCRTDGRFEVYSLPGWQRVYSYRNLGEGARVVDHGGAAATDAPDGVSPARIVELRLESFGGPAGAAGGAGPTAVSGGAAGASAGPGPAQLALVALTSENTLLVYQGFLGPQGSLRFRRAHMGLPPTIPPAPVPAAAGGALAVPRLTRFDGLGEDTPCWGIFVAGAAPALLVAARGALFPHPLYLPAGLGVSSFTPFHNVNCPFGFIKACVGEGRGSLQICQPPARTRLDAPWPRTKIPLRATPLRVAHYPEADLFAVLTARQVPYKPFLPEEEGGEPTASYAYALADAAAKAKGTMEGHEVRLVDPDNWGSVWRYSLLPGERALAVKAVHLRDSTTGATVPLLAVGAGFVAGEDYPVLGRVLLFRVHKKGGEGAGASAAGAGEPGWTASLVYSRDFRGPVSALACLEGYLLLSAGNRIETLMLSTATAAMPAGQAPPEGGEAQQPSEQQTLYKFNRTSFYDGPMLVTSLNVVKNFVLLGDAQHSVQFVRYKDEGRQLALLSKDFSRADISATEFLINGSSLHMACGDGGGVLRLLSYAPNHPGSWRGQKLVPWGAFQLGDAPLCMLRVRLHQAGSEDKAVRQAVLLGDGVGGIGVLAPLVRADSATVLAAVQRELTTALRHTAGLNPAAFRMQHARMSQSLRGARWFGQPLSDPGVLDGALLAQFNHLPRGEQARVAKAAGSSREAVLALLGDIVSTALVF